jgi:hypothetical protein
LLAVLALPLAAGLALLPFSDSRFQVAHLAKIGSSMDNDSKSLYAPSIARFNASPLQMIDLPSGSLGMPASIGNLPQPGAHAVSQNSLPVENNIRDKAKEVLISEGYNFQVIAGSFSSKSNANALVKKLRKNNFDAEIIGRAPNGYYRVSAGKVVDRQEADSLSEKLTLEGIQSWPMEI